jgi:alpha-ketoglutarate-dependent sulfate ester dioxygenase
LTPPLRDLADNLWALHTNGSDYPRVLAGGKPEALKRYHEVFTSTVYETQHPWFVCIPELANALLSWVTSSRR